MLPKILSSRTTSSEIIFSRQGSSSRLLGLLIRAREPSHTQGSILCTPQPPKEGEMPKRTRRRSPRLGGVERCLSSFILIFCSILLGFRILLTSSHSRFLQPHLIFSTYPARYEHLRLSLTRPEPFHTFQCCIACILYSAIIHARCTEPRGEIKPRYYNQPLPSISFLPRSLSTISLPRIPSLASNLLPFPPTPFPKRNGVLPP